VGGGGDVDVGSPKTVEVREQDVETIKRITATIAVVWKRNFMITSWLEIVNQ
jgi:hypothetical protein